jgi:hypothetical protein
LQRWGVAALGVAAVLALTGGSEEPEGIATTDDTIEVTTSFARWFTLSHTVNPTGSAGENPERADVDLMYDADAGSVSGEITHPERDFTIDLPGEEVEREFFEDPSCYPTPTEEP